MPLTLVSHPLCPYVQRAVIALAEKRAAFEHIDIDLAAKPDWFRALSPLGRVPVLQVAQGARETAIFESAVIVDYLDETIASRLHPEDALERARHRAWIEAASAALSAIARFYGAADDAALGRDGETIAGMLSRAGTEVEGPFFAGTRFSLVDAAWAPVFRYLDAFERAAGIALAADLPRIAAWRAQLAHRPSVAGAVAADFPERLERFLRGRGGALAARIASKDAGRAA
jgi:glutathione S-transferase